MILEIFWVVFISICLGTVAFGFWLFLKFFNHYSDELKLQMALDELAKNESKTIIK